MKDLDALGVINHMLYGCEEFEFINLEMVLTRDLDKVKRALLDAQKKEKFLDDMLGFNDGSLTSCFEYKGKQVVAIPLDGYNEFMEQEGVLDIIFEKKVDVGLLTVSSSVEDYNNNFIRIYGRTYSIGRTLTQEEFEILTAYCNKKNTGE